MLSKAPYSCIYLSNKTQEDSTIGKSLVKVKATDNDDGRNGDIRYSIDSSSTSFNIEDHLTIDSASGVVTLLKAIPLEPDTDNRYTLSIIATDDGSPSKSATATLSLTIIDVNDNCPKFQTPRPDEVFHINVSTPAYTTLFHVQATDNDIGENARVSYSLEDSSNNKLFAVNQTTGEFKTISLITSASTYVLTIIASDNGPSP